MIFENVPKFAYCNTYNISGTKVGKVYLHVVDIPRNVSFNKCAIAVGNSFIASQYAAATKISVSYSTTFSFGLYSLTGATLTLVNSAKDVFTTNYTTAGSVASKNWFSWCTLTTSATSLITPGNLFFAWAVWEDGRIWYGGTGGMTQGGYVNTMAPVCAVENTKVYTNNAAIFFRGSTTASSSSLPASYATSDLVKDHSAASLTPYILISD